MAVDAYRKALEAQPDYAEARANLAIVLRKVGRITEALAVLQKQLEEDSTDQKTILALVDCYVKSNQSANAISLLERSLAEQPEWVEGRLALGNIFFERKDYSAARKNLEQALRLSSKDLNIHLALAKLESQSGRATQAVKHLQFILDQKPDHIGARKELSAVVKLSSDQNGKDFSANLDKEQQILATLRRTLEDASTRQLDSLENAWNARRQNNLGKRAWLQIRNTRVLALFEKMDYSRARITIEELVQLDPQIGLGLRAMYFAIQKSDSLKPALHFWYKSIPDEENAWILAASGWMKQKLFTQAIDILNEAHTRLPQSLAIQNKLASAYYSFGVQQRKAGRNGDALQAYGLSIKLDPTHYKAYLNLGIIQEEEKLEEKALTSFRAAIKCKADYANGYYHLANLQWKLGDESEAKKNLLLAHKLEPKNQEVKDLAKKMGIKFTKKKKKATKLAN